MRQRLILTCFSLLIFAAPAYAANDLLEEAAELTEKDYSNLPAVLQGKYEYRIFEIKSMDQNEDMALQPEEIEAGIKAHFARIDLNGDGFIDREERGKEIERFKRVYTPFHGPSTHKRSNRLASALRNADRNEDGKLSLEEYAHDLGRRFTYMDQNGDETITIEEYRTETENIRMPAEDK